MWIPLILYIFFMVYMSQQAISVIGSKSKNLPDPPYQIIMYFWHVNIALSILYNVRGLTNFLWRSFMNFLCSLYNYKNSQYMFLQFLQLPVYNPKMWDLWCWTGVTPEPSPPPMDTITIWTKKSKAKQWLFSFFKKSLTMSVSPCQRV